MTGTRTHTSAAEPLRYTLPALDGPAWLGLRPASLAALGVTIATVVAILIVGAPLPLAALVLIAGAVPAVVPVAGRTPLAWLPLLIRHAASGQLGHLGWSHGQRASRQDDLPGGDGDGHGGGGGQRALEQDSAPTAADGRPGRSPAASGTAAVTRVPLPPECGRLQLRTLNPDRGGTAPIGVLLDRDHRDLTVVFEVIGTDRFALLEPAAQDTQLARWGTCLSALAADPRVERLQWLTHTRPDTSSHLDGHLDGHRHNNIHPGVHADVHDDAVDDDAVDDDVQDAAVDEVRDAEAFSHSVPDPPCGDLPADYRELVARAVRAAWSHEHLLTLTLSRASTGRGGNAGRPGRATADPAQDQALVESVRDLAAGLLTADLLPHPLSPAELGTTIRRLCDTTLPHRNPAPADPRQWGLLSRQRQWDSCRTDDNLHRSYAITGWPRLALAADWLAPILHTQPPDRTSRTLAIHAQPVAPAHAARQARAATAKASVDAADRSRLGFTPATTDTLAQSDAAALEAELVAGYRLIDLTALLTIGAPDPDRLAVASRALQTLSVTHRLDVRPLHGQHPHGLVACLPLGRPLPGAAR